jgi:hypothetical protein
MLRIMDDKSIFQVNHYNWGRVAYDPLEQKLLVEVPRALRPKFKTKGRLAPLEKLINERQKFVDVAGILSSPEFPYGTVLSDLVKWADPEKSLGRHLKGLTNRERLELAEEALNHSDFQIFLEYYALSRHISNNKPVLVMREHVNESNPTLKDLSDFTTYDEEFVIAFNCSFGGDPKSHYILAGALYEGEYDRDNLPESEKGKVGDIDVVATLNAVKPSGFRSNLSEVWSEDELLKVLSRRVYHRAINSQPLSLKVNDETVIFYNLDGFLYHEKGGVIEFKAELEGSDGGPRGYMISGDMLYEGEYASKEEAHRIGMVDIPSAVGYTEK